MKVSLPPSWRDFEAYRLVKIEQISTREAAKTLGISQTRICQVIERVAAFLVQMAPTTIAAEERPRMLYLAEQLAAERIDHLHSQAMASWQESKRPVTTIREVATAVNRNAITTTRSSCGDTRYLMVACRLSERAITLPVATFFSALMAAAVDDRGAGDEAEVGGQPKVGREPAVHRAVPAKKGKKTSRSEVTTRSPETAEQRSRPLDRDCSELFGEQPVWAAGSSATDFVNPSQEKASTVDSIVKLYETTRDASPVQRVEFAEPIGLEDDEEGDVAPFDPTRRLPLNRKERRARQALLNRKWRKAK